METTKENNNLFSKLGNFCRSLDKDVRKLRKIDDIGDQNHFNYVAAMDSLKGKVSDLQQLSNDCEEKIMSMECFDEFAKSLDEQLSIHFDELHRMEEFLKKFGYEIPEMKVSEDIKCSNDKETQQAITH